MAALSVERGAMVARADADVPVAELRQAVAAAGLVVVGLPDQVGARTVGELLADGEVPRRSVTGLELTLASGQTVRLGGAVLKDVTGYDVIALVLGGRGRLAGIASAHLRLAPAGAALPPPPPAVGTRVLPPTSPVQAAFHPGGPPRS